MASEIEPSQRIDLHNKWPYPITEYLRRFAWRVVDGTVVRIFPARLSIWYRFWLRVFGATVGYCGLAPTCRVVHPWLFRIGDNCSIGERVTIYNLGIVSIGDQTVISQDVYICAGTHDHTRRGLPLLRHPITVGDNVWICAGAFIGPGVSIGNGAVIGARSVVTKDVPPWTVVAGNPARVINRRDLKE
jgi:putative colanic acid biosynthesis acetyltransferase WcaF